MQDCKRLGLAAFLALASFTAACASSGAVRPQPFPVPGGTAPAAVSSPGGPAAVPAPRQSPVPTLIDTALSFRGTPYLNGGSDPEGFDCSGFTQWVFSRHGVAIPREVHEQYRIGKKIDLEDLKPGDLVFFHTVARGASHVGIYVSDDQFVHAPSSKGVVRLESINSTYWSPRFVGARRVQAASPAPPELAVVRRRPSAGESTVASATAAVSGARGSRAGD
jgi:cell wall-associated NlpC family hydrolase